MLECSSCRALVAEEARFCSECGTALGPVDIAPADVRRVVTVVFCDLAGSTALGERLDPEPLRLVMQRYYEQMRASVQRHGGTVEKFIGDAVVAVFGLEAAHEDDALRAVRAACDMRAALQDLNKDLERDHGVTLATRTGINTGEVVTRQGSGEVLGDPVNVAARLEQAAGVGEIVVGDATRRLVRDAVVLEALEPLTLKGKTEPVVAWRLVEVIEGAEGIARRLDSPMVGRDRELALLRDAYERAVRDQACLLFTVLGTAGVGKSRLVHELVGTTGGSATVLRGRCLPYGRGITFWPVREVVAQAAAISGAHSSEEALSRIGALLDSEEDGPHAARTLAAVAGLSDASVPGEETFWAVRRFLEALARRTPVIAVFEDIHWAEPAMLDLIDHIADLSRDAPMLVICPARPELLDVRPAWGGGKLNATSILLEPLSAHESERLIENLLGEVPMPAEVAGRIAEAAGGNPLYVEEMLGVLIDDGLLRRVDGRWVAAGDIAAITVPSTIQALLAARLDRLPPTERLVLEHASVVGREFWRAAVAELVPEASKPGLGDGLVSLVRKDLIRPERSSLAGHDAYRFRHILILDAAYQAIAKQTRALLHERFATWLEREARERSEIIGYHLERSFRYREEIGPVDDAARSVAARAVTFLATAGRRALTRGDAGAANLLERAVALTQPGVPGRALLLFDLANALFLAGELVASGECLREAAGAARTSGDRPVETLAALRLAHLELSTTPRDGQADESRRLAERAIAEFAGAGDDRVLAMAHELLGRSHTFVGRYREGADALKRGAEHAHRLGDERHEVVLLTQVMQVLILGPAPGAEASRWLEVRPRFTGSRLGEARYRELLASLQGLEGRFDEARENLSRARTILEDLGLRILVAFHAFFAGPIELMAGDPAAAERALRPSCEMLEAMGDRGHYSTLVVILADAVYMQGRYDEALALTEAGERAGSSEDLATQIEWRAVRSKILAARGATAEAEALAGAALRLTEGTDVVDGRWDALTAVVEVLRAAGRPAEALPYAEEALRLSETKGAVPWQTQARSIVAELRAAAGHL